MEQKVNRGLPSTFLTFHSSSFVELLREYDPTLLPAKRAAEMFGEAPHGTTIVAATFAGGVLLAGDRRTTMGNLIAGRDVDKLTITDDYSAVGFAGTVGISIDMTRLYVVELEHYEKIEGVPLSLEGKSNRLAAIVKGNLPMANAGMVSIPLFVGYDLEASDPARAGRIVSFDAVGARYEEKSGYQSIGSGSLFANSSLKKLHDPGSDEAATLSALVEALYDAADDDSATGGPDMVRRIFPTAIRITAEGAYRYTEEELAAVADAVVARRSADEPGIRSITAS